jgi:malate dehydrogenase (oxaloacetate-decarboxylating)(NADP+)
MLSSVASSKRGVELLQDPRLNKSTAYTSAEREKFGLTGLLPPEVETQDAQFARVLQQLAAKTTDLERYIYLTALLDTDETLFFKVLMSDPARFLPIVYDPTVGEACLKFGHIYRRPRGLYLSLKDRGRVRDVLRNWPVKDIRIICVSSGGRILGLGDLGANGMGIPIGKLQLYTACAAVPPQYLLPVLFDVGTNNQELLTDPLYLGLRQPRVPTDQVDELFEEFVQATQEVFPQCCIHLEDWSGIDAVRLLDRYRQRVCCFNDDIQGTASIALAGIISALRVTGGQLRDQRILFLGAGSAGTGIAKLLASTMMLEGLSATDAHQRIWLFDINGLIESTRTDLLDFQHNFAHPHAPSRNFEAVVDELEPTALIGVSTRGKAFTQKVIESMAKFNHRPIIFALSNPTEHAECVAEEAYRWSDGRALFASGVPFPPVRFANKTFVPGQGNNLFVFPAVGLAIVATHARRVTDEMFIVAARAVADEVTPTELDSGLLYPSQRDILATEIAVAVKVADNIFERGFAGVPEPADLRALIEEQLYRPEYAPLRASEEMPHRVEAAFAAPAQV